MKRNLTIILLLFFLAASVSPLLFSQTTAENEQKGKTKTEEKKRYRIPREALDELDIVIKDTSRYLKVKTHTIDSLKNALVKTPAGDVASRIRGELALAECYRLFNADSAVAHSLKSLDLATTLGDKKLLFDSRISLVLCLSTGGIGSEAETILHNIEASGVSEEEKIPYWYAGRILYGYQRFFSQGFPELSKTAETRYWACNDSLVRYLPAKSSLRKFLKGEILIRKGHYVEAAKILEDLMRVTPDNRNIYSMAAYQLAIINRRQGNETMYATYLAKSAAGDIRGCVREGLSLPDLAEWLYAQGDINTASNYINVALNDASLGSVRTRTYSIARLLPAIDNSYRDQISSYNHKLVLYLTCSCILLTVSIILFFVLFRQIKISRANEKKVIQSSQLKDFYIGNFIALSSNYAARLDSLCNLVVRKLSSGLSDELLKLVKSGKFAEEEDQDFDKIFDAAFLSIYPDFTDRINTLLKPDEKVDYLTEEPGGEKRLTPELRIYALVRLGVTESTKIAKILRYGNSTVYNYRNKMRSRAIDRDTFEDEVLKL